MDRCKIVGNQKVLFSCLKLDGMIKLIIRSRKSLKHKEPQFQVDFGPSSVSGKTVPQIAPAPALASHPQV